MLVAKIGEEHFQMRRNGSDGFLSLLVSFAVTEGVPRRSFYVALVVGTILNLINQGDVLWGDEDLNVLKLALTYCVPYCVATYGAVTARLHMGAIAARD